MDVIYLAYLLELRKEWHPFCAALLLLPLPLISDRIATIR